MFKLAQAILFMLPAETAHHVTMSLLKVFYKFGFIRNSTQLQYGVRFGDYKTFCLIVE